MRVLMEATGAKTREREQAASAAADTRVETSEAEDLEAAVVQARVDTSRKSEVGPRLHLLANVLLRSGISFPELELTTAKSARVALAPGPELPEMHAHNTVPTFLIPTGFYSFGFLLGKNRRAHFMTTTATQSSRIPSPKRAF